MDITVAATVRCRLCRRVGHYAEPADFSSSVQIFSETAEAIFTGLGWVFTEEWEWKCPAHAMREKEAA